MGNSNLSNGDAADFQLFVVGSLLGIYFYDANSNGQWDDGEDITQVQFKTHLTSLYLSMTSELTTSFTAHGGLIWYDIRTKDISYDLGDYYSDRELLGDMKKSKFSVFGGLEHQINTDTYSLFEFGSTPKIEFDDDMKKMSIKQLWYSMVGVRFFIAKTSAIDAGFRYRSDYSGLADIEIIVGLNIGIDVVKMIRDNL